MASPVNLPELGDGIESGDVLDIFVSEGDVIEAGQDIVEMETDKATVPVPSDVAGKVVKICVSEGDSVPIGGALIEVEAASGAAAEGPAPTEPPQATMPKADVDSVPAAQSEQPRPQTDSPAISRQSGSGTAVPATPPTGTTSPADASQSQSSQGQSSQAQSSQAQPPATASESASSASGSASSAAAGSIAAGPAIRRFAREVGVDLGSVSGSGDNGRITRDDVLSVVRRNGSGGGGAASSASSGGASAPARPANRTSPTPAGRPGGDAEGLPGTPGSDDHGPIRVERMSKIRKTIARQMEASWSSVPRVTNFDDADVTDLERLRQSSKEDYAAQGLKLTTMPFLIKAVATSLRRHPALNAVIDGENDQLIYKDYANIGIAVDTDGGLMVPVLRNVDAMGIPEIARQLAGIAAKARGGGIAISDMRGGSFTISNLGAIGGQYSTPIVNVPEVAILLVGRSRKQAVVMPDDSIQPRLMMPLSLSYDHRLVDGATAGRFLNEVIGLLQAPSRLLLAL